MAKRKAVAAKPEPPKQNCTHCGKLIQLTDLSRVRFDQMESWTALKQRGFFYVCECKPFDLQVCKPEVWSRYLRANGVLP